MIFFPHTLGLWFLYRIAMWLKRRSKELKAEGGWKLILAYLFLAFSYVMDFFYNAVYGTMLQLGIGTLTFSATLSRIRTNPRAFFVWQLRIADFYCEELLNRYDPSGKHC